LNIHQKRREEKRREEKRREEKRREETPCHRPWGQPLVPRSSWQQSPQAVADLSLLATTLSLIEVK